MLDRITKRNLGSRSSTRAENNFDNGMRESFTHKGSKFLLDVIVKKCDEASHNVVDGVIDGVFYLSATIILGEANQGDIIP